MANFLRRIFCVLSVVCLLAFFFFIHPAISGSNVVKTQVSEGPVQQINKYFSTQTVTYSDGTSISRYIINGPPKPSVGYGSASVVLPTTQPRGGNQHTHRPDL